MFAFRISLLLANDENGIATGECIGCTSFDLHCFPSGVP